MWYGVSSIAARFINYLLTPYLTYIFASQISNYGKLSLVYAAIPLINVLFTYGFETAYFRFSKTDEDETKVYSTASISLFTSTILLSGLLWIFKSDFAAFAGLEANPLLIKLTIIIIALDALCILPFAKLRYEGRPVKFAIIRIAGIIINIGVTVFFLSYCSKAVAQNPFFNWLTEPGKNGWNSKAPSWNFSKYLVNEKGQLTHFFGPSISPLSAELLAAINQ